MKKFVLIIISLVFTSYSWCQNRTTPAAHPAGNRTYYGASAPASNAGLAVTIDKSTKWIAYNNTVANQPLTNFVFLEGTQEIGLYLIVKEDSARFYRYTIIEDKTKWLFTNATPKSGVKMNNIDRLEMCDLGKFDVSNKTLTIETYKITERNKVSSVTIYNKPIKPAELSLTLLGITTKKGENAFQMQNEKDRFKFKIDDSIKINSIILSIQPTDLTFIHHVYIKKLPKGKNVHVSNTWDYGYINGRDGTAYPHLLIDDAYFTDPGDYEVSIIPELSFGTNAKALAAMAPKKHFTVLKSPITFSKNDMVLWSILLIITAGVIASVVIYFNKRKSRQQLLAGQQQREYAQLQLTAVRSQLNPHFMFNALSGIQNLMNKNEPDQANRYLTKFARITRSVLNNNDLISLDEEKSLLDDYLQMEQLRFGFKYALEFDPELDLANIEIPSMLLQPIVENAVKHGVAELGENGMITIKITKRDNDLIIFITDNGKGFDSNQTGNGLGLTLTRNRISLLNSIYKAAAITLDIKSASSNAIVTVTLSQWL